MKTLKKVISLLVTLTLLASTFAFATIISSSAQDEVTFFNWKDTTFNQYYGNNKVIKNPEVDNDGAVTFTFGDTRVPQHSVQMNLTSAGKASALAAAAYTNEAGRSGRIYMQIEMIECLDGAGKKAAAQCQLTLGGKSYQISVLKGQTKILSVPVTTTQTFSTITWDFQNYGNWHQEVTGGPWIYGIKSVKAKITQLKNYDYTAQEQLELDAQILPAADNCIFYWWNDKIVYNSQGMGNLSYYDVQKVKTVFNPLGGLRIFYKCLDKTAPWEDITIGSNVAKGTFATLNTDGTYSKKFDGVEYYLSNGALDNFTSAGYFVIASKVQKMNKDGELQFDSVTGAPIMTEVTFKANVKSVLPGDMQKVKIPFTSVFFEKAKADDPAYVFDTAALYNVTRISLGKATYIGWAKPNVNVDFAISDVYAYTKALSTIPTPTDLDPVYLIIPDPKQAKEIADAYDQLVSNPNAYVDVAMYDSLFNFVTKWADANEETQKMITKEYGITQDMYGDMLVMYDSLEDPRIAGPIDDGSGDPIDNVDGDGGPVDGGYIDNVTGWVAPIGIIVMAAAAGVVTYRLKRKED